jgi:hypothetical protein
VQHARADEYPCSGCHGLVIRRTKIVSIGANSKLHIARRRGRPRSQQMAVVAGKYKGDGAPAEGMGTASKPRTSSRASTAYIGTPFSDLDALKGGAMSTFCGRRKEGDKLQNDFRHLKDTKRKYSISTGECIHFSPARGRSRAIEKPPGLPRRLWAFPGALQPGRLPALLSGFFSWIVTTRGAGFCFECGMMRRMRSLRFADLKS